MFETGPQNAFSLRAGSAQVDPVMLEGDRISPVVCHMLGFVLNRGINYVLALCPTSTTLEESSTRKSESPSLGIHTIYWSFRKDTLINSSKAATILTLLTLLACPALAVAQDSKRARRKRKGFLVRP